MFRYALCFFVLMFVFSFSVNGQYRQSQEKNNAISYKTTDQRWVDSVFNSLTFEERIAQLFLIRTYSNKDQAFYDSISRIIKKYNIGGLTFFQGGPVAQAKLTNYWQSISKTPLLITIDAEWGLGMRLDSSFSFPRQMTLGAIDNDSLIYKMAYEIGKQCKRIGVDMNFAPVVDINNNPKNPVINSRSFGEDKTNVAKKGAAFIKGLQNAGTLATAKHFPGHGDTDADSHKTLPVLKHSKKTIDTLDLIPFEKAINSGVAGIMVAHLFVPSLDSTENIASSLSKAAISKKLKNELGFEGLVITDALDMRGVTNYHEPGDIEVKALIAGNDILLLPLNIPKAIRKIKRAVRKGLISEEEINNSCRKILEFKQKAGLDNFQTVETNNIYKDINTSNNELLSRKIFENAITIVKNEKNILPLFSLDTLKIASVAIGAAKENTFQETLGNYSKIDHFQILSNPDNKTINTLLKELNNYNLVIVGIHKTSNLPYINFGISANAIKFITLLKKQKKVILDIFGNPYSLAMFEDTRQIPSIIISYEDNLISQEISAEIIFGSVAARGRLPVTASKDFKVNTGIQTRKTGRLKYTIPEELGINSKKLEIIDSLVKTGINEKAIPGCQVLFAKDGKVFYNKSFGYFTYQKKREVENTDLYDLASITKIAATTLSVMKLYEDGDFDIDRKLSDYLPYLKNSNKKRKVTREIMAHQAQLQPWIPFYEKTLEDYKPDTEIYRDKKAWGFSVQVAKKLFIADTYRDSIYDTIVQSELRKPKEYKYSDLGFYLIYDAIGRITNQAFDKYLDSVFYKPLGLSTMCYLPLNHFEPGRIAPTENDTVFRKQLILGYVHDPGAAMLGGISGHAGLFSNSNDVAIIMQMLLQGGKYGGLSYFDESTIKEFTKQQFPLEKNRRGVGFDKPYPEYDPLGPCCESASLKSFGHSGFTGTYVWADPENKLIYVFLSNRVFPDADNMKLIEMDLRTRIHQAMYDILSEEKNKQYSDNK